MSTDLLIHNVYAYNSTWNSETEFLNPPSSKENRAGRHPPNENKRSAYRFKGDFYYTEDSNPLQNLNLTSYQDPSTTRDLFDTHSNGPTASKSMKTKDSTFGKETKKDSLSTDASQTSKIKKQSEQYIENFTENYFWNESTLLRMMFFIEFFLYRDDMIFILFRVSSVVGTSHVHTSRSTTTYH
jgi:hypothetical protein